MRKTSDSTPKASVAKKGTKAKASSPSRGGGSSSGKATADLRILIALAQKRAFGDDIVDRQEIQTQAAIANESSFKVTCGKLRSSGLIDYPCGKTLSITEAGLAKLGPEHTASIPKTNEEVHAATMELIKNKKSKDIFLFLSDGSTRSKAEIAASIGYDENVGSFKTYFGAVTKYIDKLDNKMYRLSDKNFPFGRPNAA